MTTMCTPNTALHCAIELTAIGVIYWLKNRHQTNKQDPTPLKTHFLKERKGQNRYVCTDRQSWTEVHNTTC